MAILTNPHHKDFWDKAKEQAEDSNDSFKYSDIQKHLDKLTSRPTTASDIPKHWTIPPALPSWSDEFDQIPRASPYIPTQKEHSMKLFTFATSKPSASVIWNTLLESDIPASDGLTVLQIKYIIFYHFQNTDFMVAKASINTRLATTPVPGLWTGLGLDLSVVRSLIVDIPSHFPHWVADDLYIPYYISKQLPDINWTTMFDLRAITTPESQHLDIDSALTEGLTAFKCWRDNTNPMQVLFVDPSLPYYTVSDRRSMESSLQSDLRRAFDDAPNHIITSGTHHAINPFKISRTSAVPPPPPSKPSNTFTVGDTVKLRTGLVVDKLYGDCSFYNDMQFTGTATVVAVDNDGDCTLGGFQNKIFNSLMIELVAKGSAI